MISLKTPPWNNSQNAKEMCSEMKVLNRNTWVEPQIWGARLFGNKSFKVTKQGGH